MKAIYAISGLLLLLLSGCAKYTEHVYCEGIYFYFAPTEKEKENARLLHVFIDFSKLQGCSEEKRISIRIGPDSDTIELSRKSDINYLKENIRELRFIRDASFYRAFIHPTAPDQERIYGDFQIFMHDSFTVVVDEDSKLVAINLMAGRQGIESIGLGDISLQMTANRNEVNAAFGEPHSKQRFYAQ